MTRDETKRFALTLDVTMQFALLVQILQTLQELSRQDGNVLFTEHTGFHLP
jgi:hypothetical protein